MQDRGATLLWMALMMVVFLGMAAIVVDLGMAWAVKRQLSSTADAAALAGAHEAGLRFKSTTGCPSNVPDPALVTYIQAAVAATHNANAPLGSTGVPTATVTCDPTQVNVAVTERSSLQTFFGPILGVSSLQPGAAATANVFGSNSGGGLRPFTVCLNEVAAGFANPASTQQSIYALFNGDTVSGETLVLTADLPVTASNNRIDPNTGMGLSVGQYIRIDVKTGATGLVDGYYWVEDTPANKKYITVSTTLGGGAVDITADGTVDVYAQPAPVGNGASAWAAASDTVTETSHGLAVNDKVWVAVRTPSTQAALSGFYYVIGAPTTDAFQLSATKGGVVFDLTVDVVVDVYKATNQEGGACNPTGSPGNWGYASFGLGGSQPVLQCLIEYGYNGAPGCFGLATGTDLGDNNPLTPEVTAPGNSGNSIQSNPSFEALLTDLLNDTILLPVAGVWTQNGSNATYQAKGGAAVKICGWAFPKTNNDPTPTPLIAGTCWKQSIYDAAAVSGKLQGASLVMQWQYVKAHAGPFGGQSTEPVEMCEMLGPTCIPAVRLIA